MTKTEFFSGIFCLSAGFWLTLTGLGIFPSDAAAWKVPLFFVALLGVAVTSAGLLILQKNTSPRTKAFMGTLIFAIFTLLAGWIGFGPGERAFNVPTWLGRTVFGFSTLLLLFSTIIASRSINKAR